MKKSLLLLLVLITAISLGTTAWSAPSAAAGKPQTTCPVMGGNINKNIYADYEGKRVYFCCAACISEFNKEPAKYLKKLEAEGVQLPSSGGK